MTPTPAELTCTHRLASRPRPAIVGLLKPSIEVYCTQAAASLRSARTTRWPG